MQKMIVGTDTAEWAILLHGLGRHSRSMNKLARALSREGYHVLNIEYPSRSGSLNELVSFVHHILQKEGALEATRLHVIGHSLGTRIILALFGSHAYTNRGRIVLLAPPLQGSRVARYLARSFFARMIFGPVLHDLSKPIMEKEAMAIVPPDVLVVRARYDPLVQAEEATHRMFMHTVSAPCTHTFIMRDRAVIEKIISFLKSGEVKK